MRLARRDAVYWGMVWELDVWHAARDLIGRYRSGATLQAARRIDDCIRSGDWRSQETWRLVLDAVEALQDADVPNEAARLTLPALDRILPSHH